MSLALKTQKTCCTCHDLFITNTCFPHKTISRPGFELVTVPALGGQLTTIGAENMFPFWHRLCWKTSLEVWGYVVQSLGLLSMKFLGCFVQSSWLLCTKFRYCIRNAYVYASQLCMNFGRLQTNFGQLGMNFEPTLCELWPNFKQTLCGLWAEHRMVT